MEFTAAWWERRGRHCCGFLRERLPSRWVPHIHDRNIALVHRGEGNRRGIDRIPGEAENRQVVVVLIEDEIRAVCPRL